jgi:hypothetical protein
MRILANGRRLLAAATVLAGASALLVQGAEARTNYAVLVGVTHYPNVQGADLIGPRNDAMLVRDYLTTRAPVPFDPQNVTVLAEDIEGGAGSPTHAAITGALTRIAAGAQPGDFVYVQLSGHGMQQPAADPASEPDGMDEVFLPADIGQWTDPKKGVPSAFTDNEIGAALDAIRQKGAFVWIVIDACHSGTATRAAGTGEENVVERKLDPKLVGIPDSAFETAEAAARVANAGAAAPEEGERALMLYANAKTTGVPEGAKPSGATSLQPGGMVAFFAAQTIETTPEMPLPRGDQEAKRYGLFTYTIMSVLAENPSMSYRQLGQSVLQAYAADNRNRPTPLFEGNLDAPVFGTESGDYVRQWKVKVAPAGITVEAGRLQGVAAGARLAILPSPGARIEEALGYLDVRSAENLTAKATTVEADGKPALAPSAIPANAYARLTEVAFDTELTVSRPAPDQRYAAEIAEVGKLLEEIAADKARPLKLKFVDAREPADIKLAVMSEADVAVLVSDAGPGAVSATLDTRAAISDAPRLWFLPPTAEVSLSTGRRPPSIGFAGSTPEGLENEVADNLQRIFRATNLARLAAASDFRPEEFSASFKIRRGGGEKVEPLEPGKMPRVRPGDQIDLVASNGSNKPVDINVLYIGSNYSINHMYAERLHGGSEVNLPLLEFNADSFGIERMVVVLSEAKPQSVTQDLSFLAQEGVRQATRSAEHPDGFAGLLQDIGTAPATRGAMRLGQSSAAKGAVLIYPLENMPEG